jgi:hypothetical protein
MALVVAPNPRGMTWCTLFIQNQSAALNATAGSCATFSGFLSPSKPRLFPAGP